MSISELITPLKAESTLKVACSRWITLNLRLEPPTQTESCSESLEQGALEQSTSPPPLTVKPQTTKVKEKEASRSAPLIVYSYMLFVESLKSYKDFMVM